MLYYYLIGIVAWNRTHTYRPQCDTNSLTEVCLGGDGEAGRGEGQPGQQRGERLEGGRVGDGEGQEVAVRLGQGADHVGRLAGLKGFYSVFRII